MRISLETKIDKYFSSLPKVVRKKNRKPVHIKIDPELHTLAKTIIERRGGSIVDFITACFLELVADHKKELLKESGDFKGPEAKIISE